MYIVHTYKTINRSFAAHRLETTGTYQGTYIYIF